MKLLVIGMVALLVLGGVGAGAYFYFGGKKAEASIGETEEHQAAKEAHGDGEQGEGHDEGRFKYVELDPLILPIINSNGVSQNLSLVIVIEVESARAQKKVEDYQPRLKDAYIQELYGVLNRQAAMEGGVLQIQSIKARLRDISRRVVGEDEVNDVLLQVVQQRPL
ncbi:MAG: flagellar basal body-associated FliL family protein [Rhodospirillales bacterium]|nr:flagellar basal body-associated FliL family protein [Rhodospirillales bacterium]